MTKTYIFCVLALLLFSFPAITAEPPDQDEVNPLLASPEEEEEAVPEPVRDRSAAALFNDASLTLDSGYYGRARSADNRGRLDGSGQPVREHKDEIHVNVFGQGVFMRSGYAWGIVGFDVGGVTNLGRGRGWSEVLYHKEPENRDRSSVALGEAALKLRLDGGGDYGFDARGGFTPISVGTLGTSGGLHSHSYRGLETKVRYKNFWLGYGWADRFRNEWDDTYRDMTNSWHQNRWGYDDGKHISYVHSLGARYEFGPDNAGFVDAGVGEGRRYRRNAQAVASVPVDLGCIGKLTLTGYGMVAKYREYFDAAADRSTEYHVSGMASLKTGLWTFSAGWGHTRAPDSQEMQFRLTAWGNSDNRNFIQTWAQLDDFVWDGQNVVKTGVKYEIGEKVCLPGLSVGASYNFGWNARNPGAGRKSTGWEVDYHVEYAVREGRLKGLAMGLYAGHLRYANNNFHGKQNRNDIKAIVTYSKTLESFLRHRQ